MRDNNTVKKYMEQALFSLMEEKPFAEITVSELVKKANVARASFYRNYHSTSDILDDICANLINQIASEMLPALFTNDKELWKTHVQNIIHRASTFEMSIPSLKRENILLIFSNISSLFHRINEEEHPIDSMQKYRIIAIIGIITNSINVWINSEQKESEEELTEILVQLVMKL